jgi:hypothetical protein
MLCHDAHAPVPEESRHAPAGLIWTDAMPGASAALQGHSFAVASSLASARLPQGIKKARWTNQRA